MDTQSRFTAASAGAGSSAAGMQQEPAGPESTEPAPPRRPPGVVALAALAAVAVVALAVVAVVALTRDDTPRQATPMMDAGTMSSMMAGGSTGSMMGGGSMGSMMGGGAMMHGASSPTIPGGREVAVSATSFRFQPSEIHVRTGEAVNIVLAAADTAHDFTIDELGVHVAASPGALGRGGLRAPSTPGRYTAYCSVAGHRQAGMTATVVVDEG
jgi:heme/copper-type cytochrome/quinol oxidase subunit 2